LQYRQFIAGGGFATKRLVHTVLAAKPMALLPLLAALQITVLFAIEDSI